jgi:hypothetical protein
MQYPPLRNEIVTIAAGAVRKESSRIRRNRDRTAPLVGICFRTDCQNQLLIDGLQERRGHARTLIHSTCG